MKLFPQDGDVVLYETGFGDDILNRKAISKQLSDLVERIENPIVIALDDKWGSGKTYFLKRWVAAHKSENGGSAVTVYFDAFESDYLSDPLVSIITAISERIPKEQQSTLQQWKSAAAKLAKPLFGIGLSLATFGAKEHLKEVGDVIADAASSEVKDASQRLWNSEKERKDAIKSFKELLVKLTKDKAAPIVIVVDELDRCRPDYALLVLEVIKHFFTVPKVHFILGVNGAALENSVKARYGADMDAESYLRKFINVSFSLPRIVGPQGSEAAIGRYAKQLIIDMNLPNKLSIRCANLLLHVAAQNEVSLRDVGKVCSKIALLPEEAHNDLLRDGWIDILCVLLVSSVVSPKLHLKFISAMATIEEVRGFLGVSELNSTELIAGSPNPNYKHDLTYWLITTLFACGQGSALDDKRFPLWKNEIGEKFGRPHEPKKIAAQIQKDWVDVFRL